VPIAANNVLIALYERLLTAGVFAAHPDGEIVRGEKEIGADILLRISEEFEKSIEWLLTGKE
jgi:hypothetical protein